MEDLGRRIQEARKLAGLTQAEAADTIGTTARTWQRWEADDTSGGALRHLDDIAKAVGVAREELLGRGGDADSRVAALEERVADLSETVTRLTELLRAREDLERAAARLLREER